jgi:ABC-type Fe3+/spermidine/putrescine transport system ATPase subunit
MSFCVKTHDIELVPAEEARGSNVLPGVVRSQAYLGSTRDYIVDIGQEVLVTAPPTVEVPSGSKVGVRLRADRLRGLVR